MYKMCQNDNYINQRTNTFSNKGGIFFEFNIVLNCFVTASNDQRQINKDDLKKETVDFRKTSS